MNIAVIGGNKINNELKRRLAKRGFVPFLFENIEDVTGFSGEIGSFTIETHRYCVNAGFVITVKDLHVRESETKKNAGSLPFIPLLSPDAIERIGTGKEPVVFVLDYPYESPEYMTVPALEKAVKLARKKRRVIYASKFIRTAGKDTEKLYKEARNSGVVFFRYNNISIDYNEEEGIFSINAKDGLGNLDIDTCFVIAPVETTGESSAEKTAKVLKVRQETLKDSKNKEFFMFPVLTNRKGIYSLNVKPGESKKNEWIADFEFILGDIEEEIGLWGKSKTSCEKALYLPISMPEGSPKSTNHVEIDTLKCAFCYTCFRACPHMAMVPDKKNSVMMNMKNACAACGICVSICPAAAVKLVDEDMAKGPAEARVKALADNLEVEYEKAADKKIEVLCCENSSEIAAELLKKEKGDLFKHVSLKPVSCGGELDVERIISALKHCDKVLVAVCTDEACRHFEGNKRARRSVENAKKLLKDLGMDENRVDYVGVSHAMTGVLRDYIIERS